MKTYYTVLSILLLGAMLSGCMSMSAYKEASLRHHAYASGQTEASPAEWDALISEFQGVIEADPDAQHADDAQYGIASSWLWRVTAEDTEAAAQAIEALQTLIRNYPNSQYLPEAHYWLGQCYAHIGEDYQAITQYQYVESRYADSDIFDAAQLELARLYAKQVYVTRASTLYKGLIESSSDADIVAAATTERELLETQQQQVRVPPPKKEVQVEPEPEPIAPIQPATPTPDPQPLVPESLTREFGLTAKTIVIDPGHGGKDPGAVGKGNLHEKAVVLSISEKLREALVQKGYTVLMTRRTNEFIQLRERTAFATRHKADLFVSIHANGSHNAKAHGIETFYLDVNSSDSAAEALAMRENADSGYSIQELETLLKGIIQQSKSGDSRRLATQIQNALVKTTGAVDRGVKHARFVVLIGTNVPAVLVETGFISNATEGQKLATAGYQQKVATAIAEGIEAFLGNTAAPPFVKNGKAELAAKDDERNR